jgi:hypothetical protein
MAVSLRAIYPDIWSSCSRTRSTRRRSMYNAKCSRGRAGRYGRYWMPRNCRAAGAEAPLEQSSRKCAPHSDPDLLLRAGLALEAPLEPRQPLQSPAHLRRHREGLHRSDKPVAAPRQGLDKSRVVRRDVEGLPEPFDGRVETMLKVDESVGRPKFPAKLFACNQLAGVFKQRDQDLNRLPFQPDFSALPLELARTVSQATRVRTEFTMPCRPSFPIGRGAA